MKKKFLWLGLSFLLVAALVLSSCGPAEGQQEEEEEEEEEEEGPQYGGRLTLWWHGTAFQQDAPSPTIVDGYNSQLWWLGPIQEGPIAGDMEKYGPKGTGEYDFTMRNWTPLKYMRGILLEDWELTSEKMTWHVRPGIHWAADNVDWMENRELTADDMVFDLLQFRNEAPAGKTFKLKTTENIHATDRYTLEIPFSEGLNTMLLYIVGFEDRAQYGPPEVVEMGLSRNWEDQVGTGSFMFKKYVRGSYMLYERNPNYWDTITIDGKEYELPFADEIMVPIIPDKATQIAALKTGEFDMMEVVASEYWAELEGVAGLISKYSFSGAASGFQLKVTEPPLDDINVRRALMIGTDIEAFIDATGMRPYFEEIAINFYPAFPGDPTVYIPLEDLPAEDRLLFDYNPELARQMLADAGYPDGFKITVSSTSTPVSVDRDALLADQWAKIGVDVTIDAVDQATFDQYWYAREFQHVLQVGYQHADLLTGLHRYFRTDGVLNASCYSNSRVDELVDGAFGVADPAEQSRLGSEAALIVLTDTPFIPASPTVEGRYWWPWVHNTTGGFQCQDWGSPGRLVPYLWIDQDLKAEMGY